MNKNFYNGLTLENIKYYFEEIKKKSSINIEKLLSHHVNPGQKSHFEKKAFELNILAFSSHLF